MASMQFGQPISSDVEEQATQAVVPNGPDAAEVIDLNDPRLTSELLDVNLDGDAYAFPPPPPDGKYRAKIQIMPTEQVDAKGGKSKVDYYGKSHHIQGPYLCTAIKASIIDPTGKYDGIPVFDRWVSTFMSKRDNATKIQTILKLLKQPSGAPWVAPGTKMDHTSWMKTFIKALAGEPEIGIETQWEWSCQGCGEEAKKKGTEYPRSITGMQKFPADTVNSKPNAPVYQSEMKCAINAAHGFSRAQVRIARFLPLAEVKR